MALPQVKDFLTNFLKTKIILPKTVTSAVYHETEDGIERLDNIVDEMADSISNKAEKSDLTPKSINVSFTDAPYHYQIEQMGKLVNVYVRWDKLNAYNNNEILARNLPIPRNVGFINVQFLNIPNKEIITTLQVSNNGELIAINGFSAISKWGSVVNFSYFAQ